jgi:uncharacterized membrane protein
MRIFTLLPWQDWLAVVWFFGGWMGYAWFARHYGLRVPSILRATNRYRHYWMLQATGRDPRVVDGIITQNLSSTPAFFSSTTIIIIGGLFALLGTTDKASELVREIPFAVQTSVLIFDLKVLMMIGVFVFAFFRFSWSMRQYTFVALLIGSLPPPSDFESGRFDRETFADQASRMVGLAAETFNDGLRAYYLSFAIMAWFFSTIAFVAATAVVILILYNREFRSEVLAVLKERAPVRKD